LYDQIRNAFDNVFLLGDAVAPEGLQTPFRDGFEKAMLLHIE